MTEEQIKQNALAYAIENYGEYDEHNYTDHSGCNICHAVSEKAFIAGAKWADEHPNNPWVSVEDRLPEKNCTVFVTTNGLDEDVAHFRIKSKRFITVAKEKQKLLKKEESTGSYSICGDCIKEERYYSKGEREDITDSVTHWMPIPELKKGE